MALAVSPRRRWAGLLLVALLGSGRAFIPAPRSTPTARDVARHGKGFGAAAQKSKKPLKLLKKEKAMTAEEREEAYYRRWFWDQASAAIDERFGRDHTEAELRRVRAFVAHNRDVAPLPKALARDPHYDALGGFFPGLSTRPFHADGARRGALAALPGGVALEAAFPEILAEMTRVLDDADAAAAAAEADARRAVADAGSAAFKDVGKPDGWTTMQLYYKGRKKDDFPFDKCPRTMEVLSSMDLAPETVAFQRQRPGTGLPLHVDPCSWVLGCHLGMKVPSDEGDGTPWIEVSGEKYRWKEGEVMLFDPSFRHRTYNPTSRERIILNIDVMHPELTALERDAIALSIALKKELFGAGEDEARSPDAAAA